MRWFLLSEAQLLALLFPAMLAGAGAAVAGVLVARAGLRWLDARLRPVSPPARTGVRRHRRHLTGVTHPVYAPGRARVGRPLVERTTADLRERVGRVRS